MCPNNEIYFFSEYIFDFKKEFNLYNVFYLEKKPKYKY